MAGAGEGDLRGQTCRAPGALRPWSCHRAQPHRPQIHISKPPPVPGAAQLRARDGKGIRNPKDLVQSPPGNKNTSRDFLLKMLMCFISGHGSFKMKFSLCIYIFPPIFKIKNCMRFQRLMGGLNKALCLLPPSWHCAPQPSRAVQTGQPPGEGF